MIWYDYTRLKYNENRNCSPRDVKKLVDDALEEIEWVKSILRRKKGH
jgi:hypothetical protein